jgi:hypothetical protein
MKTVFKNLVPIFNRKSIILQFWLAYENPMEIKHYDFYLLCSYIDTKTVLKFEFWRFIVFEQNS